jgi:hypothetical protein
LAVLKTSSSSLISIGTKDENKAFIDELLCNDSLPKKAVVSLQS